MTLPKATVKFVEAWYALGHIRDDSVVAISGFNMPLTPEYLIQGLYHLYRTTGHPRNLFIVSDTFPGTPGRGLDWVAEKLYRDEGEHQEFIRGMLVAYYGWSKWLQLMAEKNLFEAYTWPICVLASWFRDVASGKPGTISRVGLGTFIDPRFDGGALNDLAKERMTARTEVIVVDDEEYLMYKAPLPTVALIRGSRADEQGNISLDEEGVVGPVLQIAQSAKAKGRRGIVIAQILYPVRSGTIEPKKVVVPGPIVDYIVRAPPERHWQSASIPYDPRISGQVSVPMEYLDVRPEPLSAKKVIARRVLLEMVELVKKRGSYIVVNLGVGIPSLVSTLAAEENISDLIIPTVESGPWGGIPLHGQDFGVAISPRAIIPLSEQFVFYEGGIIDAASLGFLQVNQQGHVNASILPGRLTGPGGFPCISMGAPRIYFAGRFTAGKQNIQVGEDGLKIIEDGPISKFVKKLYKTLYCPCEAVEQGREHLYITERAVFKLTHKGLELVEVAPGVDLERDVIGRMEFEPVISKDLRYMDRRIFSKGRMGIEREVRESLKA
ncbi:MAG: acyl CoA:acetate/3-ketoacid CoA transferase [Desulfurococcales archaeon]|nr:acyl CoA:acetate/3-ketoacid CoA transferase [Desulfurococcales archaeon]